MPYMPTPKHTPGPWEVFPLVHGFEIRAGDDGPSLLDTRNNGHNDIHGEANARLAAAAPALVEALQSIRVDLSVGAVSDTLDLQRLCRELAKVAGDAVRAAGLT